MDIRKISDQFFVSPQITAADLANLADTGVQSIICNRPDGEQADQPTFQALADTATRLGIAARHIPIAGGLISDADVEAFDAALDEMPKPILAYCRSGTRSATLWSLAQADEMPVAEILSVAKGAGYDLTGIAPRIANGGKALQTVSAR